MNKKKFSISRARELGARALAHVRSGRFMSAYHILRERRTHYEQDVFTRELFDNQEETLRGLNDLLENDRVLKDRIERALADIRADLKRISAQRYALRRYTGRHRIMPRYLDTKT